MTVHRIKLLDPDQLHVVCRRVDTLFRGSNTIRASLILLRFFRNYDVASGGRYSSMIVGVEMNAATVVIGVLLVVLASRC